MNAKKKRFIIEIPHTETECSKIMEKIKNKKKGIFLRFNWSCAAGDHIGWAIIDAESKNIVRQTVPEFIWQKINISEVKRFSDNRFKGDDDELNGFKLSDNLII